MGLKACPGRVRGLEGRETPLIGRSAELDQVLNAVETLRHSRQGQILLVTGEAGLGKSRLTAEFTKSSSAESVRIYEGNSLSYRQSISYWTFREVFHRYFDFQEEDNHRERQLKIRRQLSEVGGTGKRCPTDGDRAGGAAGRF